MDVPRQPLSDAEREVLKLLWEHGPAAVRDVQAAAAAAGLEWTRSTVITLLQRLEKKDYVASDRRRHAFVFRAVVSREDVMRQRMGELADELCDGRPAPLLLAFAERQSFTTEELRELRQLIDDLARKRTRTKRR